MVSACSLLTDIGDLAGDGGIDAPADALIDTSPDAPSTAYHDITNASYWSSFDLASVSAEAAGYYGAAFDGRCLYFVPSADPNPPYTLQGVVMRFDTTASFTSAASWSTFDATAVSPNALGFAGAAFDGRYLYLVPSNISCRTTRARTPTTASSRATTPRRASRQSRRGPRSTPRP